MILRPRPGPFAVLFALRGSILPQIAPRVGGIALLSLAVVVSARWWPGHTPVPFAYTLLVHRTAMLFCLLLPFGLVGALGLATPLVTAILAYAFFGLDALGTELEAPFEATANGLALDAMVRGAEIDLLDALGTAELPAPLRPAGFLLS